MGICTSFWRSFKNSYSTQRCSYLWRYWTDLYIYCIAITTHFLLEVSLCSSYTEMLCSERYTTYCPSTFKIRAEVVKFSLIVRSANSLPTVRTIRTPLWLQSKRIIWLIATTTNVQLGINLSLRLFDKSERALAGAAVMMRLRNSHLPWTLWYRWDIYSLSTFFVDSGTFLRLWIQRDQTTRRKSEDNFWHFPSSVSIIGSESRLNYRKGVSWKAIFSAQILVDETASVRLFSNMVVDNNRKVYFDRQLAWLINLLFKFTLRYVLNYSC